MLPMAGPAKARGPAEKGAAGRQGPAKARRPRTTMPLPGQLPVRGEHARTEPKLLRTFPTWFFNGAASAAKKLREDERGKRDWRDRRQQKRILFPSWPKITNACESANPAEDHECLRVRATTVPCDGAEAQAGHCSRRKLPLKTGGGRARMQPGAPRRRGCPTRRSLS